MNFTTLYINSVADKIEENGSSSSKFKILLNDIGINNIKNIMLKNIIIPFSYYSTVYAEPNTTSQTVHIIESPPASFSINIDAGNYTESQLANLIQTELNLNSPSGSTYSVKIGRAHV